MSEQAAARKGGSTCRGATLPGRGVLLRTDPSWWGPGARQSSCASPARLGTTCWGTSCHRAQTWEVAGRHQAQQQQQRQPLQPARPRQADGWGRGGPGRSWPAHCPQLKQTRVSGGQGLGAGVRVRGGGGGRGGASSTGPGYGGLRLREWGPVCCCGTGSCGADALAARNAAAAAGAGAGEGGRSVRVRWARLAGGCEAAWCRCCCLGWGCCCCCRCWECCCSKRRQQRVHGPCTRRRPPPQASVQRMRGSLHACMHAWGSMWAQVRSLNTISRQQAAACDPRAAVRARTSGWACTLPCQPVQQQGVAGTGGHAPGGAHGQYVRKTGSE